ncbi:MAG: tyrosine-type recombinase/integrase [Caldilineaceae bacterium]|nr:tyrosine-type recombinase/integrase [Caldilineaceae bacterium]
MSNIDFPTALEGYWLARRRDFSQNTINDYTLTFKRFAKHLGSQPISEVTPSDIHAFLNAVKKRHKLADKTMANIWAALSSFFTWAETELKVSHPIRGVVSRPEFHRVEIEPYTRSEIMAMLTATEQSASWRTRNGRRISSQRPTALRDKTILIMLVDTGLRASELCDLLVRDYEQESGRLLVRHGKGNKKRTLYLGQAGQKYLWRYLTGRGSIRANDPLFITRVGTALDRTELLNMITGTAARAGVSHANVHRFRHTFAITFLRNGGNVLELQKMLGHERMETVRIYAELASMDLSNAQAAASPADNWGL